MNVFLILVTFFTSTYSFADWQNVSFFDSQDKIFLGQQYNPKTRKLQSNKLNCLDYRVAELPTHKVVQNFNLDRGANRNEDVFGLIDELSLSVSRIDMRSYYSLFTSLKSTKFSSHLYGIKTITFDGERLMNPLLKKGMAECSGLYVDEIKKQSRFLFDIELNFISEAQKYAFTFDYKYEVELDKWRTLMKIKVKALYNIFQSSGRINVNLYQWGGSSAGFKALKHRMSKILPTCTSVADSTSVESGCFSFTKKNIKNAQDFEKAWSVALGEILDYQEKKFPEFVNARNSLPSRIHLADSGLIPGQFSNYQFPNNQYITSVRSFARADQMYKSFLSELALVRKFLDRGDESNQRWSLIQRRFLENLFRTFVKIDNEIISAVPSYSQCYSSQRNCHLLISELQSRISSIPPLKKVYEMPYDFIYYCQQYYSPSAHSSSLRFTVEELFEIAKANAENRTSDLDERLTNLKKFMTSDISHMTEEQIEKEVSSHDLDKICFDVRDEIESFLSLDFSFRDKLKNKHLSYIAPVLSFKNLRTLDLTGNDLTELKLFQYAPELTNLVLKNNKVSDISDLKDFELKKITINLTGNYIEKIQDSERPYLLNVSKLILKGNFVCLSDMKLCN